MRRLEWYNTVVRAVICACVIVVTLSAVMAQTRPKFAIKALAERTVDELPAGPLYWRLDPHDHIPFMKDAVMLYVVQ